MIQKYRAWHKKEKRMYEVACLYFRNEGLTGIKIVDSFDGDFEDRLIGVELDEVILLQPTGLKDKNGKEIFEGDILKDDQDAIKIIKFGKLPLDKSGDCVCTYPAFYCSDVDYNRSHECEEIGDWMKVIGNIYENPKLLKEKV